MQKNILIQNWVWVVVLTFYFGVAHAQILDLRKAEVIASDGIQEPVRGTAIKTLQEEVETRTDVQWKIRDRWAKKPTFVLAKDSDQQVNEVNVPSRDGKDLPEMESEGFRIVAEKINGQDVLWLIGADERGVIFAIGEFLRQADLAKNKINFDKKYEIRSEEHTSELQSRGHLVC